ncbi:alkaline phosphatase [Spirosoma sp. RP8]|uniref:Alkaline phosphatase n=1 Tax=Spirosoma liriopis TaxID=2937440 RepID=A0ABT0HQV3_9BACT|nr:alkaline phosphatase [Spirosoma liriopis]MCK8494556.1 alkaline phosphatase [Spirosoma liriopis]
MISRFHFFCLTVFLISRFSFAQPTGLYTTAQAHSHNDYAQNIPFLAAYYANFGSIEADVHAYRGQLYVAHDSSDVDNSRTLERLYIQPILQKMQEQGGKIYKDGAPLQLLIDLKTPASQTLPLLIKQLGAYPAAFGVNGQVRVVVSGTIPAPDQFNNFPDWLLFDGRPDVNYTADQLKHIGLISQSFLAFSRWNGKGLVVKKEAEKLQAFVRNGHQLGKKIRLWATPDNINTWKALVNLGVDYINTDQISGLAEFLNSRPTAEFQSTDFHAVYEPIYRNNDARSRVRNVILLIGDGMGLAQIYTGLTANRGNLNLAKMLNIGFSKTSAADTYITDSAAGATAMATGQKTNNRAIGVDSLNRPLLALPAQLKKYGIKSGLITAGSVTDATPAAFYAHQPDRSFEQEIATDFLATKPDILIGGGLRYFKDQHLLDSLRKDGYRVGEQFSDLTQLKAPFVLLDDKAVVSIDKGRGNFLTNSLQKVVAELKGNQAGFFMMVEGAQIDYGGHVNNMSYVAREMLDFDKAIGEAMRFADADGQTLVIVTADHETGGLTLLDGNLKKGYVDGHFSTNDHTGVMVPVFAYGPHSLDFRGVYENTDIYQKIMAVLKK